MVYNTQNYWVSGLCSLSEILNPRKHNVSETASLTLVFYIIRIPDDGQSNDSV
jgi:hypothetical protein